MIPLSVILHKQGTLLLKNQGYAWLLTGLLAVTPFAAWSSLVIIALITLRLGWLAGFKCLAVGLTAVFCFFQIMHLSLDALLTIMLSYLLCYLSACLLRQTASWQVVASFVTLVTTVVLCVIHGFMPQYIMDQYQLLQETFKSLEQESIASLLANQSIEGQLKLANYLLGIRALSIIFSAISSLLMARAIQSALFYVGGFKKEILAYRGSILGVILLLITAAGAYQNNSAALSCLPIFCVYMMMAGLSLSFNMMVNKGKLLTAVILLGPIFLFPYIALPVYVVLGTVDSLFNLRLRLPFMVNKNHDKG